MISNSEDLELFLSEFSDLLNKYHYSIDPFRLRMVAGPYLICGFDTDENNNIRPGYLKEPENMIGVMYLDNSQTKAFSVKVEECIAAYKKRLDKDPKLVLVNEMEYKLRDTNKFSVPVRPDPVVLPGNFWVGEEHKK